MINELTLRAKNAGKKLDAEVPSLLIERLGLDWATLVSETDKLICFVGTSRSEITKDDVLLLSPSSKGATLWQIAEDVIWEKGSFPPIDSTLFHGLVPALRAQLHLGLSLATLIEQKVSSDKWSIYLPKLWPKTLEKRSAQAAGMGSEMFKKGLEKLLYIELKSRNNSTQYKSLLDLFRAQFYAR
jgi:DNA polymerase III delta subunit